MPTMGCQINIMLDPEKRDLFKRKAHGEGKTINELVNQWIDLYLESQPLTQPNLSHEELEDTVKKS